jgi:uncharacterized membrane protein YccC
VNIWVDSQQICSTELDFTAFSELWKKITKEILSSGRFVRSVEIDGQLFYDRYDDYLARHFHEIQTLHVQTMTETESLRDTFAEMESYSRKWLHAAQGIVQRLYGEMSNEDRKQFAYLIEGMTWLYHSLEFAKLLLDRTGYNAELAHRFASIQSRFADLLPELETGLAADDPVSAGDVLQYEIIPLIEQLAEALPEGVVQ